MAKLKCEYCEKDYITYTPNRSKHNFCSKECFYKFRTKRKKVTIKCEYCEKEFERYEDEIKKHNFCSVSCLNKWQGRNKLHFICKTCGKEFTRSPSNYKRNSYCCIECRNKDKEWIENTTTKANLMQNKKKGLNKLEIAGNKILDSLNILYDTQILINNKICVDVLIKDKNIIIQWDGDYWHAKDLSYEDMNVRQKRRHNLDISQDSYLKKCGYTVLRFWESDVYNRKEYVYENIKRAIQ